ncbi:glycosyl transferase possibly involved in lipopolysaccharide synthesis [Rivularia sp. PCC 7116]|uniref:sugar transferase n=1 Tax=Rivularia sp. PCC 7116 TaxID=373994 RepID=UPI00029F02A7|nr:sugar transferase [Rivularia sp. PCC 7116]AFY55618.1 glycosyl transferase possibly involved in lipopolysaccharide synthesis [Rivularia sp. PCC 7116]
MISIIKGATNTWVPQITPHPSVSSRFKRLLDILGSMVGLVILAIVFLPVAIAIKINSPGPIFFTQERYGLYGNTFRIRKFRSMVSDAEQLKSQVQNEANGHFFKSKNDFRVTKVGRFLRSTSLDELPQFWNVFSGEMSLVGTRPPTADEVMHYSEHHWQRLHVKPGLTGEWQVNGRSHIKDFEQVFQLDLQYQSKWHEFYDLSLIAKTIYVIFARIGAF